MTPSIVLTITLTLANAPGHLVHDPSTQLEPVFTLAPTSAPALAPPTPPTTQASGDALLAKGGSLCGAGALLLFIDSTSDNDSSPALGIGGLVLGGIGTALLIAGLVRKSGESKARGLTMRGGKLIF